MPQDKTETSPSALAMDRFVELSPGLQKAQRAVPIPGLPTLPDLKILARERRDAGQRVVDQSAGDIADVDQPLSPEFVDWIEQARETLISAGHDAFRRTRQDAYGFPCEYQPQFPVITDKLIESWGVKATPMRAVQTVSGRTAIDLALRGLIARAKAAGKQGKLAIILDPLAWSGYRPLASDLDLAVVHMPALPGHGLACSADGLQAAIDFAQEQGLSPIAAVPILPSNPTGVAASSEELTRMVETAARADVPVMMDAFYSPLAPEGHAQVVPLGALEQSLAPEALCYLGIIVGETKVTSSQNKTSSVLWMAPAKHDDIAATIFNTAIKRLRATNAYPRPQEALVAYALHTFPAGIHAAMGPRYQALDATRAAMRRTCDELGLPLSIGGSFYGTVALVDADGESLIRDDNGRPAHDPRELCELLIRRYGLVGAPGGMFSPAPEASPMVRLTAAVTQEDVDRVRAIFARMLEEAQQHG